MDSRTRDSEARTGERWLDKEETRQNDHVAALDEGRKGDCHDAETAFYVGYIEGLISAARAVVMNVSRKITFRTICQRVFETQFGHFGATRHYAENDDLMPLETLLNIDGERNSITRGLVHSAFEAAVENSRKNQKEDTNV